MWLESCTGYCCDGEKDAGKKCVNGPGDIREVYGERAPVDSCDHPKRKQTGISLIAITINNIDKKAVRSEAQTPLSRISFSKR